MPIERPILFSGPMVRAIHEGRKTQTRRIVKTPEGFHHENSRVCHVADVPKWVDHFGSPAGWRVSAGQFDSWSPVFHCPYGAPGGRLWVREAWAPAEPGPLREGMAIAYRDDYHDDPHGFNGEKSPQGKYRSFKPSIHMPRWASRINLLIKNVRVERLNDISEADAIAEGVEPTRPLYGDTGGHVHQGGTEAYSKLWNAINGPGSWDANPFVWVVEFERIAA